jgi:hypothetical protein
MPAQVRLPKPATRMVAPDELFAVAKCGLGYERFSVKQSSPACRSNQLSVVE